MMAKPEKLNILLHEIQQCLAEERTYHQDRIQRILKGEDRIAKLLRDGYVDDEDNNIERGMEEKIAVSNGRRLPADKLSKLNKNEYDIILDLTAYTLQFRRNPESHSEHITTTGRNLGVGSFRIRLLAYMLEHPGRYVSTENAAKCHGVDPDDIITPEALRKTISVLRRALGAFASHTPYIRTIPGVSPRTGRCVYMLDQKWSYLLIKWKT